MARVLVPRDEYWENGFWKLLSQFARVNTASVRCLNVVSIIDKSDLTGLKKPVRITKHLVFGQCRVRDRSLATEVADSPTPLRKGAV